LPDVAIEVADPAICSDISVLLDYIRRCGTKLVDVLTGKESPSKHSFLAAVSS